MNALQEALAERLDKESATKVGKTLVALCAHTLECLPETCTCAHVEGSVYSFSSDHATWVAVLLVHAGVDGVSDAEECADRTPPPVRTVVVNCGARTVRLRAMVDVTVFEAAELMFNPTEHVDASKMAKLTEQQVTSVMGSIQAGPKCMPMIGRQDIMVRYYGFHKGDIIRCDRRTPSGINTYYRVVL